MAIIVGRSGCSARRSSSHCRLCALIWPPGSPATTVSRARISGGPSSATLDVYYKIEKQIGALSMDTAVVRALFQNCTAEGGSVKAQIYWTKARLGWNDRVALPAPGDHTPTIADSDFDDPMAELISRLEQMAENMRLNKTVFGPILDIIPESVEIDESENDA